MIAPKPGYVTEDHAILRMLIFFEPPMCFAPNLQQKVFQVKYESRRVRVGEGTRRVLIAKPARCKTPCTLACATWNILPLMGMDIGYYERADCKFYIKCLKNMATLQKKT